MSTDFERILTENLHGKEQLKRFANSLALIESQTKVVPQRVLINGEPGPDIFSATYELDNTEALKTIMEQLLTTPDLGAEILIRGKPGRPFDVKVNVDMNAIGGF